MKNVKAYINGAAEDTEKQWGIILTETSVTALMTLPPLKSYITNESALSHGKQVLTDSGNLPKIDARDLQLVFGLHAKNLAQFLARYRSFCETMKKGAFSLTLHVWDGETFYKETFNLLYISCSQYSEYNGKLGKFTLKLNEPNPANRTVEHSSDIVL